MKSILTYLLVFISSATFACGGGDWEGMYFYNLFSQTNISAKEFYPFLRDEYNAFYGDSYYSEPEEMVYPEGNVNLWKKLLTNWSTEEIESAIYKSEGFDWSNKQSETEKRAKLYIDFAQECSEAFSYRTRRNSWDYEEIIEEKSVDVTALLEKANLLMSSETNSQLQTRYYYQLIRIMHYSKAWDEAIRYFEAKIENKIEKNEMYYYILDQVAGCYYSTENYEKAAYLFTKIVSKSIDRKKSAFVSFNFCTSNEADGRSFANGIEDEKDFLLITSLRSFSDEIDNIERFMALDANDLRLELLFMRALNNVERDVWPIGIGVEDKTLPNLEPTEIYNELLAVTDLQVANQKVNNKDFWRMASSYLSFIQKNIPEAQKKLEAVKSFSHQKKMLAIAYKVFSWETISTENENFISQVFKLDSELEGFIQEKIANTYYKNNQIAKAFLVHNTLQLGEHINSIELLDALEVFYNKPNKSDYENELLNKKGSKYEFMDYLNYQKGIYYLYQKNTELALEHFGKSNNLCSTIALSKRIFSNNIIECFDCPEEGVMLDEVYKADVFSFIKTDFSIYDLAVYLIELEKLTANEKQWKSKLANYLLANFYYNISNTGYYRGALLNYGNCCDYGYINYAGDNYRDNKNGVDIIASRKGYNLSNITSYNKKYFGLSDISMEYYQAVIDLSTDKELNARCLYLMAKCELNKYYNEGSDATFEVSLNEYCEIELPQYKSFKVLKADYSETKFHDMIINHCSYFRLYSSSH
ncbi:hypothetical protein BZG02_16560 [Labilibaculum filiforme]|uniref:Uncharacterized protein n=1 Tax=Labilibaculum filiforme TaxID=1940526 RepID=A0A2N3HT53_9BACT|nr:hypothetical protein [Labilibaculum filiforme]PKQ61244.1 hypothetical protein BZG02_16560 [Labilibaculum filiforme]